MRLGKTQGSLSALKGHIGFCWRQAWFVLCDVCIMDITRSIVITPSQMIHLQTVHTIHQHRQTFFFFLGINRTHWVTTHCAEVWGVLGVVVAWLLFDVLHK